MGISGTLIWSNWTLLLIEYYYQKKHNSDNFNLKNEARRCHYKKNFYEPHIPHNKRDFVQINQIKAFFYVYYYLYISMLPLIPHNLSLSTIILSILMRCIHSFIEDKQLNYIYCLFFLIIFLDFFQKYLINLFIMKLGISKHLFFLFYPICKIFISHLFLEWSTEEVLKC